MTWKHVAVFALVVIMVLGCGVSRVCTGSPEAMHDVYMIAMGMAGAAGGHMGATFITKSADRPPPAPPAEK